MAINKLIGKLFKFTGLKVTDLTFRKGQQLEIGVKPYKKANNRIYRAWRLKDEFERFWEYNSLLGSRSIHQELDNLSPEKPLGAGEKVRWHTTKTLA